MDGGSDRARLLAASTRGVRGALGFFTRLPVRCDDATPAVLAFAPVAGLIVGGLAALVLLAGAVLGLSALVSAILAAAAAILVTGALHEDGLADVADALGARDRARRLEIMRDSRIGTYGTCALILAIALRISLLAEVAAISPVAAAGGLVMSASLSRTLCLWPLYRLPPARPDGLGAWARAVTAQRLTIAAGIGAGAVVLVASISTGLLPALVGSLAACIAAEAVVQAAHRAFGGQTGDVAGAAQQLTELAFLLGTTISISSLAGA